MFDSFCGATCPAIADGSHPPEREKQGRRSSSYYVTFWLPVKEHAVELMGRYRRGTRAKRFMTAESRSGVDMQKFSGDAGAIRIGQRQR
jgi:hypothetical protein